MYVASWLTLLFSQKKMSIPLDYFPKLPRCHSGGVHAMYKPNAEKRELRACGKTVSRQSTLSPGIFTIFCERGEFDV